MIIRHVKFDMKETYRVITGTKGRVGFTVVMVLSSVTIL